MSDSIHIGQPKRTAGFWEVLFRFPAEVIKDYKRLQDLHRLRTLMAELDAIGREKMNEPETTAK